MRQRKVVLAVVVVALAILVVPSVFASCPPCPPCEEYTPGYWKRCVTKYVTGQGDYPADVDEVKESDSSMEAYEAWIRANINPDFTLEWAFEEFWMTGPGRQPVRQMIADWFNLAKAAV